MHLVLNAVDIFFMGLRHRTADQEQQVLQTVKLVDQVALSWSFIVLFILSTSLQVF